MIAEADAQSGSVQRWGQFVRARLDRFWDGHDQSTVPVQDTARIDDCQPDDPLRSRSEANDVPFGSLFAFGRLRQADVQVENVCVCVLVGVIEQQRSDPDVHGLHCFGSLRLASAVMIRAGCCS